MIRSFLLPLFFMTPLVLFSQEINDAYPPEAFIYVHEMIPEIAYDIRYAGENNFIGTPIRGYHNPVALLTRPAAEALKEMQQSVRKKGYGVKVFDAYRPQHSVAHFIEWAEATGDTLMKSDFYPDIDKKDLFKLGYIAERSGHTRGSTIDLTLVDLETGEELDMGSPYDFFNDISNHATEEITPEQKANRLILKTAMEDHGFIPYPEEWWHYTLEQEPFPDTYFDFPVK